MKNLEKREKVWTEYWATGTHNSCLRSNKNETFSIVIDDIWCSLAKTLTRADRVLDLCTGNGAVIEQLVQAQLKNGQELSTFIGIDLARSNPKWFLGKSIELQKRVQFDSGVSLDKIPDKYKDFSLVTSQFGFEYALSDSLVKRFQTLLVPNGKFLAIIHHKESIFIKNGEEELSHLQYLLGTDYFDLLDGMLKIMALLRNPSNFAKIQSDKNAIELRNIYNGISKQITDRANKSVCPDLLIDTISVGNNALTLARSEGLSKARSFAKSYRESLDGLEIRLQELVDVAMSRVAIDEFSAKLVEHLPEAVINYEVVMQDNYIIGWFFELTQT